MMRCTVEMRTAEGWGHFQGTTFAREDDAIAHGERLLAGCSLIPAGKYIAFRIWQDGPSIPGDKVVWDSRDLDRLISVPGGWMREGDDNIYLSQGAALAAEATQK
jgi:hypothetical protein